MRLRKQRKLCALVLVAVVSLVASFQAGLFQPQTAHAVPPYVACSPEQIRATQRWWFFGNRGVIDFGASGTTVTQSLNPQNVTVLEGSTVVTDTSGQLMFYSNGQTVQNRNNQVMPNGSGLIAAPSATQTVAAFPSLSRPGVYFVVSNGGAFENGGVGPLRYSEVNMSLDGGLGDVVSGVKNVLLDGGANTATEGLAAVPNASGTGFWVITATGANEAGNKNIVAHEFNGAGPTGTIVRSEMSTPNGNTFATFNLSPDMTKLVQHFGNSNGSGQLRLLDIDAATGVITERVTWSLPKTGTNGDYNYSADFSPDGRWVYATRIFGTGRLLRYDTQTYTTATDLQNHVEVVGSIGTNGGQVKRGPDGRMYVADYSTNHLSTVNDPNNVANPGYQFASITLPSGAISQFGLPQVATGCPIPLTAPVNLNATAAGYDRINLSWSAPVDLGGKTLLGYKLERSLNGTSWTTITANTGSTATSYQSSGLSPGTKYYYRASAVFNGSTSDTSNVSSATTSNEAPNCDEAYADCFTSPITGRDVILEVDDACEVQTAGITDQAAATKTDPGKYSYPLGLLDFELDCGAPGHTATVTQYYFNPPDANYILRKYNPNTGNYFTIQDYDIEDTTVNGRAALKVSFSLTDGGPLDIDGQIDGIITDPTGLAIQAVPGASTSGAHAGVPNTGLQPLHNLNYFFYAAALGITATVASALLKARRPQKAPHRLH